MPLWACGAVGFLGVALYVAPWVAMGEDGFVRIHDHLDSTLVAWKVLAESGRIFAPNEAVVPNLLGGLPRAVLPSEWNLQLWLYVVFDPYTASWVNQLLLRGIAWVGMFLLLRDEVFRGEERCLEWSALVALVWAWLPFWPSGGAAIAGQPWAAHALLALRRGGGHWRDWAVLVALPFYGFLIFATAFFIAVFAAFGARDVWRERRLRTPFWGGLVVFAVLHLIVDYRLVVEALSGASFVSHRTEFDPRLLPFRWALGKGWDAFWEGPTHALPVAWPVMGTTLLLALALPGGRRATRRALAGVLAGIGAIVLLYVLYRWSGFGPVRTLLSFGVGFTADRFYTLLPLLWTVGFGLALAGIADRARSPEQRDLWVRTLIGAQLLATVFASDALRVFAERGISYRAFYAESQFSAIRDAIGRTAGSYRVVSLGLHPTIAAYNGFHTADGYVPNYALEQKHALRRVMAAELEAAPRIARYFDGWGSRAYVFSRELGLDYFHTADREGRVEALRLDPAALQALGADYVLSAVEIDPVAAQASGLRWRGAFEDPDSAWRLQLYEGRWRTTAEP
ncbi:MAG: DUF6044 family protein [Myxococcota bacterium]